MSPIAERLRDADRVCARIVRHYENFTVASRLTPRRLRRDLARVYAYCRSVDDIGDETGDATRATDELLQRRQQVREMFDGAVPDDPVLLALAATVRIRRLDAAPFLDLIAANLQDQSTSQYEDWSDLLGYCRLSAAPVGRIVLRLFDVRDPSAVALSDDVCIGLQLANFAQDVSLDAARGRTYLLQRDLRELGRQGAVRAMCARARDLLASGHALEAMVRGRLRLQLALYRLGGEAILDAVAAINFETLRSRPRVGRSARLRIAMRALATAGELRVLPPQGTLPRRSPELAARDPSLRRHPELASSAQERIA